ncbi:MAG: glycoside hydrolase family 9 protein [Erysipelotrichaceae bacterium]|nr:glycoside hydrolase family 9 protein [Erysipelotrichaceae bacterium]
MEEPVSHDRGTYRPKVIDPDEAKIIPYIQTVDAVECWSIEGNGEYHSDVNKKYIHISGGNDDIYSIVLKSSPIMIKNGEYELSFTVVSDIDKTVYLNVDELFSTTLDVKKGEKEYSFTFHNYGDTIYEAIASFALGDKSSSEHDIEINDIAFSSKERTIGSRINQVGYLPLLEKQVVFTFTQGNYFMVCDAETDEVVYRGPIGKSFYENDSNEYLAKGFFKDVNREGRYYIRSEYGAYSYDFTVSRNVYDELAVDVLKFLYLQRCGHEITAEDSADLYHPACHTADAKIWTSLGDYYMDATGGWHDAGDYGRYVTTSNKVITDLLFAYQIGRDHRTKLLDEIRFGLEWTLKLQTGDGSVYNKVTTKHFADFVTPDQDRQEMYVLWPWTLTTASFAGITGQAYEVYKDIDKDFADACLEAHHRAIEYLDAHKDPDNPENPEGFSTGYYSPGDESDERLFAYIMAYRIDKKEEYLKKIEELWNKGIMKEGFYANFRVQDMVLLLETLDEEDELYKDVLEALRTDCEELSTCISDNAYSYALYSYSAGSDQILCEALSELIYGYHYLKEEKYLVKASESFSYLLGMNTLNMSFVYGYGVNYPQTMHSRLANARQTLIKGAVSGGVCDLLSEGLMSHYFDDSTPIAKRFADAQDCYNNTEPAIYYNSAFILALSLLEDAKRY